MSVLTLSPSAPILGKRGVSEIHSSPVLSCYRASSPVLPQLDDVDSDRCSEVNGIQYDGSGSDSEADEGSHAISAKNWSHRKTGIVVYHCTYPDCQKSYTRPAKLAEHERSHTGVVSRFSIHLGIVWS